MGNQANQMPAMRARFNTPFFAVQNCMMTNFGGEKQYNVSS